MEDKKVDNFALLPKKSKGGYFLVREQVEQKATTLYMPIKKTVKSGVRKHKSGRDVS